MSRHAQQENKRLTDEEKELRRKLSPATYAFKEIRDIVVNFGSIILGAVAGNWIGNKWDITHDKYSTAANDFLANRDAVTAFAGPKAERFFPQRISAPGATAGAVIGMIVSGIAQGYHRWVKHESERLAVEEINRDVAAMQIHKRNDPQLLSENETLREMLEHETERTKSLEQELEQKLAAARKIAGDGPKPLGQGRENGETSARNLS